MAPRKRSQSAKRKRAPSRPPRSIRQPRKPSTSSRCLGRIIISLVAAAFTTLFFWHHIQCAYTAVSAPGTKWNKTFGHNTKTIDVAVETLPRYPLPLYDDVLALSAAWDRFDVSSLAWQRTHRRFKAYHSINWFIIDLLYKAGDMWSLLGGFAKTTTVRPFDPSYSDRSNSTHLDIQHLLTNTCTTPTDLRYQYYGNTGANRLKSRSIHSDLGYTIGDLLYNAHKQQYANNTSIAHTIALLRFFQTQWEVFAGVRSDYTETLYPSLEEDIVRMLTCLDVTHGLVAEAAARSVRKLNWIRIPWTKSILATFRPKISPFWLAVLFAGNLEIIEDEITGWKSTLGDFHKELQVLEALVKCEQALGAQVRDLIEAFEGENDKYTFLPHQNAWLTQPPTLRDDSTLDNCANSTYGAGAPPPAGLHECAPLYPTCPQDWGLPVGRGEGVGHIVLEMPSPGSLASFLVRTRNVVWKEPAAWFWVQFRETYSSFQ